MSLRDALIGAWSLVSYIERDVATQAVSHPMGEAATGFILYTPDGYMSAQIQAPGRRTFARSDLYGGTAEEYRAAGTTYLAYSGRFFVDEAAGTLTHEMAVSAFPNWTGQAQIRLARLVGDRLHLSFEQPMLFNGALKTAALIWQRAPENRG